ncbi:MAG: AGE family epimerase/isomerase, partial [Flavobacteriaceae bacterium]|nr:AGE family epimerase/isomerase [Flavobacteriaceae bacterium]
RDKNGKFYFATTAEGKPLVQPYNIFSDCFAAMAFSQYAQATGDATVKEIAVKTYHNILERKDNPKQHYEKSTNIRPLKGFSLPMILSNLVLELEGVLNLTEVENTIDYSVHEVMNIFLDKKSGLIYEFVRPDGKHEDSFNGRLINPGHGIEAMWFMMEVAKRRNDDNLFQRAIKTVIDILEYSWDKKFGGIFYFLDANGSPTQQLEWDQKLWWVHLETLIALSKAYAFSRNDLIWNWYERVHAYSWEHFSDPVNGEWFGYLNRQGEVLLNLKGGKWKGCFHVPRAMYQCWKTFEEIEGNS